ncbi:MAG: hypothetical protein Fur002_16260 [Anaerolineales bacterium]
MNILVLKLLLAPVILGSASLAGRKWGAAVSGWLVGLPLTSGPVALIVTLSHDRAFAYDAALGTLSGGISLIAYTLAYTRLSKKFNWKVSLFGSVLVFVSMTVILQSATLPPLLPLFAAVMAVILLGLWLTPTYELAQAAPPHGKWDLPARIILATSFILLVTGIAPYIGARLTGLLTTIPLYISILTVFAHLQQGYESAAKVLRGLVLGLFSFAAFYLTLGALLLNHSAAVSFGAATLAALTAQGGTLLFMQKR